MEKDLILTKSSKNLEGLSVRAKCSALMTMLYTKRSHIRYQ